ncbi:unknown [Parabacteroides johnsonii CAG:246]|nr:unknown [Parabacteroides johnsonii CAG:246]
MAVLMVLMTLHMSLLLEINVYKCYQMVKIEVLYIA